MTGDPKDTKQEQCHDEVVGMENVSFSYPDKEVIRDLSFSVLERDFVGLTGHNGAGKTTLLRMVVGLLKPAKGEIRLFGTPVNKFRDWHRIGYVPQRKSLNPLFPATVREVVQSGLYFGFGGRKSRAGKHEAEQVEEALAALSIADIASQLVGRLSGGQQQRVLLARAIVNRPDLLILDEPATGLDRETETGFFEMLRHLHEQHRMTFLMVSHDLSRMHAYLGDQPKHVSNGLAFYVKHSHEEDNCRESNFTHAITGGAHV